MVWLLEFLLWVALASTSAYNFGPLNYYSAGTYLPTLYPDYNVQAPVNRGVLRQQRFELIIPPECQQLGICENIPNYPQDIIDRIINKLGPKLDLIKNEQLDIPSQRSGDGAEIELCSSREAIIRPQAAKGKDNSWYLILNHKHNPFQGYRVEICHEPGGSCAMNAISVFGGYTAVCRQKYVQKTMVAVNLEQEDAFDMPVRVPACCSCVAMHTGKK